MLAFHNPTESAHGQKIALLVLNPSIAFKLHRRVAVSKSDCEQVPRMQGAATSVVEFQGSILSDLLDFRERQIANRRKAGNTEQMDKRRFWNMPQCIGNADLRFHFISQQHRFVLGPEV